MFRLSSVGHISQHLNVTPGGKVLGSISNISKSNMSIRSGAIPTGLRNNKKMSYGGRSNNSGNSAGAGGQSRGNSIQIGRVPSNQTQNSVISTTSSKIGGSVSTMQQYEYAWELARKNEKSANNHARKG